MTGEGMTMRNTNRRLQAGFSLLEMTISALMIVLLTHFVTTMIISGSDSTNYVQRLNRVTQISQEIIGDMQREMRSAVRVFENDSTGLAYRSRLEAWSEAVPVASSKLPAIDATGTFKKDVAGSNKTGNELLFARAAWSDAFVCTSGNTYRVDVYRVIRYFMKAEGAGPQPGTPAGLNFCKWVSEPLVDGNQIDAIADDIDLMEVLIHLRTGTADTAGKIHARIEVAWKMGEDPAAAGTFRHIQTDGVLTDSPQSPRQSPWRILRDPALGHSGELGYRSHSVASNYGSLNQGIGRFGIINNNGSGFPHGFEVQVIGLPTGRQVLLHLTLVSDNRTGRRAYFDTQVISHVREG